MSKPVNEQLLRGNTDAAVWADEFQKVMPDADWGLMVGWFANAIETGRAAGRESMNPPHGESQVR